MSVSDKIQLLVAFATLCLAVSAFVTIIITNCQHQDQMRTSVLPMPFPSDEGNYLFPRYATSGPERQVCLMNIGNGPAMWIQWEVAPVRLGSASKPKAIWNDATRRVVRFLRIPTRSRNDAIQSRAATLITRLGTGPIWRSDGRQTWQSEDNAVLWHTLGSGRGRLEVTGGLELTLWYDDIFGNHYCCILKRHGDHWEENYRRRERRREPFWESMPF